MVAIFLDDERMPSHVTWVELPPYGMTWYVVRNYNDFVRLLNQSHEIEHVSFDHDLADQHYGPGLDGRPIDYSKFCEKTGMDCAKALVEWCMDTGRPLPNYTVHSMNPVGRANIEGLLENFKKCHITK